MRGEKRLARKEKEIMIVIYAVTCMMALLSFYSYFENE
jgi:cell division protein FtsL